MASNVLLLKSPKGDGKSDPFVKNLLEANYKASCLPLLSFTFCHLEELRAALLRPDEHAGIIFTSLRAVEAATKAVVEDESLKARKLGFHTTGEGSGSAEALVPEIINGIGSSTLPLIYPCGNLRRDTISAAAAERGLKLNAVVCYETAPDENIMNNFKAFIKSEGIPSHMVFYSPSGVQYTYETIKELLLCRSGTKAMAVLLHRCDERDTAYLQNW